MEKKDDLGKIFLFSNKYDFSKLEKGTGARYSDGSGYYEGNDGTRIQIYSDGSGYFEGADGSTGTRYSDGSGYFEGVDGSTGTKYSDGSGYFEDEEGNTENFYSENNDEGDDSAYSIGATLGEGLAGAMYGFVSSVMDHNKKQRNKGKRVKTEEIEKETKSDRIIVWVCFIVAMLLMVFNGFFLYSYFTPKDGEIMVTINAKDYIGIDYKEVENKFRDMGFTNIKCIPKEDLVIGWINKEGETDKISIDKNTKITKYSIFKKDGEVEIVYHSFKDE